MTQQTSEFSRAAKRILYLIDKFKQQLSRRDFLMMQIGMRASHIEEALSQGDTNRAQGHLDKLTKLISGIPHVKS